MRTTNSLLIRDSLRKWTRTPGFLMVLAVALIPPALTGAWAWTHQDDLALTDLEWDNQTPEAGDLVNFTISVHNTRDHATDPFNVTLRIGYYEQRNPDTPIQWRDVHNETEANVTLTGDERRDVTFNWTSEAGTFQVEAYVDFFDDQIPEIEEQNNYRPAQIQVRYQSVRPQIQTPPPANNTTDASRPEASLRMESLTWDPDRVFAGDAMNFTIAMRNDGPEAVEGATLSFQVYRLSQTGSVSGVAFERTDDAVAIAAGENMDVTFQWDDAQRGLFAAFAFLDSSAVARGDNETDNVLIQQFDVQRRLVWDEPEEKATAKAFYREDILLPIHFTLLVPLIGLFYAGGVLHDDRSRGNLVYMLTRPVARWRFPLIGFASSFLVALAAVLVGVVLTYVLLLGTPQDATGYFWWPLAFGALVLFVYAAAATALGVVSDRPYLVGLLYILGFETLILAGRRILVNGAPLVQDWVLRLSLSHWVQQAYAGWDPDDPSLPSSGEPLTAILVLLGIGIASLVIAAVVAQRREFGE